MSHPATMDLVLRKRICFTVVKRHSLAEKLKRKLGQVIAPEYPDLRKFCETCLCFQVASVRAVSVRYEIVSNVPKVVHISKSL